MRAGVRVHRLGDAKLRPTGRVAGSNAQRLRVAAPCREVDGHTIVRRDECFVPVRSGERSEDAWSRADEPHRAAVARREQKAVVRANGYVSLPPAGHIAAPPPNWPVLRHAPRLLPALQVLPQQVLRDRELLGAQRRHNGKAVLIQVRADGSGVGRVEPRRRKLQDLARVTHRSLCWPRFITSAGAYASTCIMMSSFSKICSRVHGARARARATIVRTAVAYVRGGRGITF